MMNNYYVPIKPKIKMSSMFLLLKFVLFSAQRNLSIIIYKSSVDYVQL